MVQLLFSNNGTRRCTQVSCCSPSIKQPSLTISAVFTDGRHAEHFARVPREHRSPLLVCVRHVFLMFKHEFCWKYQYNKYMFNFIDHLHFYSCKRLCRQGPPVRCFARGGNSAVKTVLPAIKSYKAINITIHWYKKDERLTAIYMYTQKDSINVTCGLNICSVGNRHCLVTDGSVLPVGKKES